MASVETLHQIPTAAGGNPQADATSASSASTPQDAGAAPNPVALQNNFRAREQFLKQLWSSDSADDAKTRSMQRFFGQNDTTGSEDGDKLHGHISAAGGKMSLVPLGRGAARAIHMAVAGHPAHQQMVDQVKGVMRGEGNMPTHLDLARAAGQALGDTGMFGASTGQPVGNLRAAGSKLAGDASSTAPTSTPTVTDPSDPNNTQAVSQAVTTGTLNEPQVQGDVIGFVYSVMMQAQIDGNKDKREELNHTKMLNGMLDGLNEYMDNTLMPAQKELANKTNSAKKGDDTNHITVAIDGVPQDMDTDYAMTDKNGKVKPIFTYDNNGGRTQANQTELSNLITQMQQWQTSIQNNQTKQTNRFQATDSAQTSNMNIINSLLKNVHDATSAIVHNQAT